MRLLTGTFFPAADDFVPVVSGLPALETWSVADLPGSLNGDHPWVDYIGTHGWGVVSQAAHLQSTGSVAQGGRMVVDLGGSDYTVTCTVAEFLDTGSGLLSAGPCARMQGDASLTFYTMTVTSLDGAGSLNLLQFNGGAQSTLGSIAFTPRSGMTLGIRCQGATITGYADGVPRIPATGAINTGRFVGIQGVATAGNRVRLDTLTARALRNSTALELMSLTPLTGLAVGVH